jgi:hypothetical protein
MAKTNTVRISDNAKRSLNDLTRKLNDFSLIPISKTKVLELLIITANHKTPAEILAMLQKKSKS